MKIEFNDQDHFTIYLRKEDLDGIDLNKKDQLEIYLKRLFKRLKKIYRIDIKGYYYINVYIDQYYGVVLEISKEKIDYYDYLDNFVDMRIKKIPTYFLYEIRDINIMYKFINKAQIYSYDNKIFIRLTHEIDYTDMLSLMEFTKIIYNVENMEIRLINIDKSI